MTARPSFRRSAGAEQPLPFHTPPPRAVGHPAVGGRSPLAALQLELATMAAQHQAATS
jgi:hypothetical protein